MNRKLSITFFTSVALALTTLASCHAHRSASATEVAASTFKIETHTSVRDTSVTNTLQSISSSSQAIADSVTCIRGRDSTVIIHIYRPRTRSTLSSSREHASTSVTARIDSATIADTATACRNSVAESEAAAPPALSLWGWLAIALAAVAILRWVTTHA